MSQAVYTLKTKDSVLERWKATIAFLLTQHKSLSGFHISVSGGAHTGVATAFEGQPYTVGSGPNNNLILFGDDLEETHARFTPTGKLGNQLRVDAIDGRIGVDDRGNIRPGEWTTITEFTTLKMGGAEINIAPIMDPRKITRGAVLIGSIAILAFLVSFVLASSWSESTRSINALLAPPTQTTQAMSGGQVSSPAEVAAARGLSQIRLGELGIAHLVKVTMLDKTSLAAEGLMPDSLRGKWNGFLQWYDSQPNYPPLINNVTMTGKEQDVPAIATVWLGKKPIVQFSDGTKGSIGSIINGGWEITGIYRERVDLTRNGVTIAIALNGGAS